MPRKKKPAGVNGPLNLEELARRGAVSKMQELLTEARALEQAYPGTQQAAQAALQREALAKARAVKAAQPRAAKPAKDAPAPAPVPELALQD